MVPMRGTELAAHYSRNVATAAITTQLLNVAWEKLSTAP